MWRMVLLACRNQSFPAFGVSNVLYKGLGHPRAGEEMQMNVACQHIVDAQALGLLATCHGISCLVGVLDRPHLDDPRTMKAMAACLRSHRPEQAIRRKGN